jgi:hypothetical protein
VHAAETADIAALSGRHAARHIAAALRAGVPGALVPGELAPGTLAPGALAPGMRRPMLVEPPLWWISPNVITSAAPPPLGRFVLRSQAFRRMTRLEVSQDGRLLARSRPVRMMPARPVHLTASWLSQVDPTGGPVRVAATP